MLYLVDLFCGGGGTSTGASKSENTKVIYCVNHDPIAIKSHAANHPDCIHAIEDIRILNLEPLRKIIKEIRENDENAIIGLWASLECTNHSKAKGGLPRDADSRTLANDLFRYLSLDFDMVYIENVREFMAWGPLDEKGKPISRDNGIDYQKWVHNMKMHGYNFESKLLNSADFGAYTSRLRYFAQFAKPKFIIRWPEPTHSKKAKKSTLLFPEEGLQPWKAVKDVLNLEEHGKSIFEPGRITSDKTFERIHGGLITQVAGMKKTEFIQKYYGTGKNIADLDEPSPTVTTKDRLALVKAEHFVYRDFSKSGFHQSVEQVAGTITTVPKMNLVSAEAMVLNFNSSTSPVKSVNEPSPTITTVRTHYIINPSWFNTSSNSIENPCPTLIARMDKAPHYLITTDTGELAIEVYETDLPHAVKIKEFMALYGLKDVKMRMFSEVELLRIMGFPEEYVLCGNQTQNKKFIGNAVEVTQAFVILDTSAKTNIKNLKAVA